MQSIIKLRNISKKFITSVQTINVLKNITFDVSENDFLILFGKSGCGKSTLLYIILGLEEPTEGSVEILNTQIFKNNNSRDYLKNEDERGGFRMQNIGMVYQQPYWIQSMSVAENVSVPLTLLGIHKKARLKKTQDMLEQLEIAQWSKLNPKELSSGQQQLVSLARALITNPKIIVADEPTGNLDYESGQKLIKLLSDLNKNYNKTILMVTHDLEYLSYGKTIVKMFDGEVSTIKIYKDEDKQLLIQNIKKQKEETKKNNTNL